MIIGMTVIMCLSSFTAATGAEAVDGPETVGVEAQGMVCTDADSGRVLYDKSGDERFYPASLTKVLTALVVLENTKDLDKETTVSDNAVNGIDPSSSHIALDVGEKITIRHLLYGLLLCSGNDCAVALAEETSGSVKEFAKLMNEKAKELGMDDSHFTNPHGLFNKKHYTTPKDMAKVMRACVKNKEFVEIFSTIKHVVPKTNKSKKRELWNNHRMVKTKYAYYKGVVGGKTGYITESSFNLITYARRGDLGLIAVAMRNESGQDAIVKDTAAIFDYYFKKYHVEVLDKNDIPKSKVSIDGKVVGTKAKNDIRLLLPKGVKAEDVKLDVKPYDEVTLPIKKGEIVGKVTASYDDRVLGASTVVSTQDVISRTQELFRIGAAIFVVAAMLAVAIAIVVAGKKRKKKRVFGKK